MLFDWDPPKAASNLRKHGVSFDEATTAFFDPFGQYFDDYDHSLNEERFLLVGYTDDSNLVMVSHTDRGDVVRLISARSATRKEQRIYHENRRRLGG